jgi:hypothetical protein
MQAAGWSFEPAPSLSAVLILSIADTVVLIALMVLLTRAHGKVSGRSGWAIAGR